MGSWQWLILFMGKCLGLEDTAVSPNSERLLSWHESRNKTSPEVIEVKKKKSPGLGKTVPCGWMGRGMNLLAVI